MFTRIPQVARRRAGPSQTCTASIPAAFKRSWGVSPWLSCESHKAPRTPVGAAWVHQAYLFSWRDQLLIIGIIGNHRSEVYKLSQFVKRSARLIKMSPSTFGARVVLALALHGAASAAFSPPVEAGVVTTVVGSSTYAGKMDGVGTAAYFNTAADMTVTRDGSTLFVADYENHLIRTIDVGSQQVTTLAGLNGTDGYANGFGTNALFNYPTAVSISEDSMILFVGEEMSHCVRMIAVYTKEVTTLAGSSTSGHVDGVGTNAQFGEVWGVAAGGGRHGTIVYVADYSNEVIRMIDVPSTVVTTLAGTSGTSGYLDGAGLSAIFSGPNGLALSHDGHVLYVAEYDGNRVRALEISTGEVTTVAGDGTASFADGAGEHATFNGPVHVAVSVAGSALFVADDGNNRIRKIVLATKEVTTVAGSTGGYADGMGTSALFDSPAGVAVPANGMTLCVSWTRPRALLLCTHMHTHTHRPEPEGTEQIWIITLHCQSAGPLFTRERLNTLSPLREKTITQFLFASVPPPTFCGQGSFPSGAEAPTLALWSAPWERGWATPRRRRPRFPQSRRMSPTWCCWASGSPSSRWRASPGATSSAARTKPLPGQAPAPLQSPPARATMRSTCSASEATGGGRLLRRRQALGA